MDALWRLCVMASPGRLPGRSSSCSLGRSWDAPDADTGRGSQTTGWGPQGSIGMPMCFWVQLHKLMMQNAHTHTFFFQHVFNMLWWNARQKVFLKKIFLSLLYAEMDSGCVRGSREKKFIVNWKGTMQGFYFMMTTHPHPHKQLNRWIVSFSHNITVP